MPLETPILSVTNLTNYIKGLIDREPFLSGVTVEGEISNFTRNSSGHLYFTLKDEGAQISAVMFKSLAQYLTIDLRDGDKVYLKGSIEVYPKGGRYQIYVSSIKKKGIGDLYQKYEELKKKLDSKGYFDRSRKRPLPKFPKNIALITSRTGAVIEDLKTIILKRSRFSNLTLYPTQVQGDTAKFDIVEKIKIANSNPDIDVIIIARGGGSIEDLWPFNEEIVADAIYNSKKPIISAVGHETDFTISDFTADLRAATPSDAALIVVRDSVDLKNELDSLNLRLNKAYINYVKNNKIKIDNLSNSVYLKSTDKLFMNHKQNLMNLCNKLDSLSPKNILEKEKQKLDKLNIILNNTYKNNIESLKHKHLVFNEKLCLLNPLSVLDKGYSITYKNDQSLKDTENINIGDRIVTKLKNGTIYSIVEKKEN